MKKSFAPLALALLSLVLTAPVALAQDNAQGNVNALVNDEQQVESSDEESFDVQQDDAIDAPVVSITTTSSKPIAQQVRKPIARVVRNANAVQRKRTTTQPLPASSIPNYLPLYLTSEHNVRDSLIYPGVIPQPDSRCCLHKRHYGYYGPGYYGAPYGCGYPCYAPCGYPPPCFDPCCAPAPCFDPCFAPAPCLPPCDPCAVPCPPPCPKKRHCVIRARRCAPECVPPVYPVAPPVVVPPASVAAPCASCQG